MPIAVLDHGGQGGAAATPRGVVPNYVRWPARRTAPTAYIALQAAPYPADVPPQDPTPGTPVLARPIWPTQRRANNTLAIAPQIPDALPTGAQILGRPLWHHLYRAANSAYFIATKAPVPDVFEDDEEMRWRIYIARPVSFRDKWTVLYEPRPGFGEPESPPELDVPGKQLLPNRARAYRRASRLAYSYNAWFHAAEELPEGGSVLETGVYAAPASAFSAYWRDNRFGLPDSPPVTEGPEGFRVLLPNRAPGYVRARNEAYSTLYFLETLTIEPRPVGLDVLLPTRPRAVERAAEFAYRIDNRFVVDDVIIVASDSPAYSRLAHLHRISKRRI